MKGWFKICWTVEAYQDSGVVICASRRSELVGYLTGRLDRQGDRQGDEQTDRQTHRQRMTRMIEVEFTTSSKATTGL